MQSSHRRERLIQPGEKNGICPVEIPVRKRFEFPVMPQTRLGDCGMNREELSAVGSDAELPTIRARDEVFPERCERLK